MQYTILYGSVLYTHRKYGKKAYLYVPHEWAPKRIIFTHTHTDRRLPTFKTIHTLTHGNVLKGIAYTHTHNIHLEVFSSVEKRICYEQQQRQQNTPQNTCKPGARYGYAYRAWLTHTNTHSVTSHTQRHTDTRTHTHTARSMYTFFVVPHTGGERNSINTLKFTHNWIITALKRQQHQQQ